jgi:hypothetical protein|uniref:Uncharacterized protein ycf33 n=1 Tax=Octactis speculum TaxID=3111310 RepID=A0A514CPL1_9STRA|nr:conserved hypothetical plastid protein Ycf33 [Dictyocha speculum]QDH81694.1 conserved hypothetical plastid protein Ycf33 [Dictyocha speculum]|tara:strand:+ start:1073 stop:1270 length:198 start_codon:yes stop_codon:yes gene_type:complete
MLLFWKNVGQFPRFFITSLLGLVFILLSPVLQQAKKSNLNKILTVLLFVTLLFILLGILNAMFNL